MKGRMQMRKAKKTLLAVACAAVLVVGSIAGTMAYLTDKDEVKNTFTVGQVYINLDEANVDELGRPYSADSKGQKDNEDRLIGVTGDEVDRVKSNSYKLIPGCGYVKDPTVTVLKGSEESYVKMTVTVSFSKELDAIFAANNIGLTDVFEGYKSANWIYCGNVEDATENTRTYTFLYKETVAAPDADAQLEALFDAIKVPGTVTKEQLTTLCTSDEDGKVKDQMTITVNAYAVQAAGFKGAETDKHVDYATAAFTAAGF